MSYTTNGNHATRNKDKARLLNDSKHIGRKESKKAMAQGGSQQSTSLYGRSAQKGVGAMDDGLYYARPRSGATREDPMVQSMPIVSKAKGKIYKGTPF